MKNAPQKIWLQFYGDGDCKNDNDIYSGEVTWCEEKIFKHDVQYLNLKYVEENFIRKPKPRRNFCYVCEYYLYETRPSYLRMCACNKARTSWRKKHVKRT